MQGYACTVCKFARVHLSLHNAQAVRANMPIYDVAGVPIDFPYDAYPVQLAYMEKVVLALNHGQNALLESPTGTGKTLCLLCAALGWRREQVERVRASLAATGAPPGGGDVGQALKAQLGQAPGQAVGRVPRVVYASRTHSQLKQVVKELRRTVHRPTVCVIGSREQLCVHPQVKAVQGSGQAAACQALTAALGCSFHAKLQVLKRKAGGASLEHPEKQLPDEQRRLPDIEDFVELSLRHELCPFYYARELQATSEVLFVPYNARPCHSGVPSLNSGVPPFPVRCSSCRTTTWSTGTRAARSTSSWRRTWSSSTRRTTSSARAPTPRPST